MSEPEIRRLDPYDDAAMDTFQMLYVAAERAVDDERTLYSRADGDAILRSTGAGWFGEAYGAFEGQEMVGVAMLTGNLTSNRRLGHAFCWVPPTHGRHGIGGRLVSRLEDRLRELGRDRVHAQVQLGVDGLGGRRAFAERQGYTLANTEVERVCRLPAPAELLDRLAAEAAPHHPAYDVRVLVGPVPEDLAEEYCRVKNLMHAEMPTGALELENENTDPTELAQQDADFLASGRTRVSAVALTADGTLAAYSVAMTSEAGSDHVDQWGTLVDPPHRGHRLGLAVKVALVRALGERFPDKRRLVTENAESNAHMIAINQALGFEVRSMLGEFQKRLQLS